MPALQFLQGCFLASVHLRRALIQRQLVFGIVSAVEVGDQRRQVKPFLDRQSRDLFPDFSHAHNIKLNRILTFGKMT
jgi:hypothetical protein